LLHIFLLIFKECELATYARAGLTNPAQWFGFAYPNRAAWGFVLFKECELATYARDGLTNPVQWWKICQSSTEP